MTTFALALTAVLTGCSLDFQSALDEPLPPADRDAGADVALDVGQDVVVDVEDTRGDAAEDVCLGNCGDADDDVVVDVLSDIDADVACDEQTCPEDPCAVTQGATVCGPIAEFVCTDNDADGVAECSPVAESCDDVELTLCPNLTYYRCMPAEGPNPATCVDIDECAEGFSCPVGRQCVNRQGRPPRCRDTDDCVIDNDTTVCGAVQDVACLDLGDGAPTCRSEGTIIWVDSAEEDGDGSYDRPFGDLSEGLDAASDGDTIMVRPGEYEGNFDVPHNNIAIIGTARSDQIILRGDGDASSTLDFDGRDRIYLANVSVQGGTIRGIDIDDSNDSVVRHVTVRDVSGDLWTSGIRVNDSHRLTMVDVRVTGITNVQAEGSKDNGARGIRIEANSLEGTYEDIVVRDVTSSRAEGSGGAARGIECDNSRDNQFAFVEVEGIRGGSYGATGHDVAGIHLDDCDRPTFLETSVRDVTGGDRIQSNLDGSHVTTHGLLASYCDDAQFERVSVHSILGGDDLAASSEDVGDVFGILIVGDEAQLQNIGISAVGARAGGAASSLTIRDADSPVDVDYLTCYQPRGGVPLRVESADVDLNHTILVAQTTVRCLELSGDAEVALLSHLFTGCQLMPGENGGVASFVSADNGDLRVPRGAPTIDAGSTTDSAFATEPEPNGCAANLGAWGNTPLAATGSPGLTNHCE